jgi:hypothetical protein
MSALVAPWSAEQKSDFLKRPIAFRHGLVDTGLVEDDALVAVLERYPDELIDINLFDSDDASGGNLRTGKRGGLDGAQVLDAVKRGRVWVQLRGVQQHYPALGRAVRSAFREIAAQTTGFRPVNVDGQLILSAPGAKVPYHADAAGVILFHMRGRKRVWIYPNGEAHLPQEAMEKIAMRATTEDLPYARAWDADAQVFDLQEGQALAWPQHAPHRVENLEGFCVSFSADYQTWDSRFLNGAHVANGVLRQRGWRIAPMSRTPRAARAALWAASLALKRFGKVQTRPDFEQTFELGSAA